MKNKNVRNTIIDFMTYQSMCVVSPNAHGASFPVGVAFASSWPTQVSMDPSILSRTNTLRLESSPLTPMFCHKEKVFMCAVRCADTETLSVTQRIFKIIY